MFTLNAAFPSVEALSLSSPVENAAAVAQQLPGIATGDPIRKPRSIGSFSALC